MTLNLIPVCLILICILHFFLTFEDTNIYKYLTKTCGKSTLTNQQSFFVDIYFHFMEDAITTVDIVSTVTACFSERGNCKDRHPEQSVFMEETQCYPSGNLLHNYSNFAIYSRFTHSRWWFSVVLLVHQKGCHPWNSWDSNHFLSIY